MIHVGMVLISTEEAKTDDGASNTLYTFTRAIPPNPPRAFGSACDNDGRKGLTDKQQLKALGLFLHASKMQGPQAFEMQKVNFWCVMGIVIFLISAFVFLASVCAITVPLASLQRAR